MKIDTLITQQPSIESDRFDLRPLRRSDKGLIMQWAGDDRVARMTTSIPHPLPPGAVDAYIARARADDEGTIIWAIDGAKSDEAEVMGVISLNPLDDGPDGSAAELGYWIAPVFWNTGIASAAVRAVIDANPLGCKTLFASVFQDNPASARVLTHCGFAYLGDAEGFSVARNATVPTWTYSRKL
ncbi:MAG: GNAT family N-acetyltransferase [Marinibacterium sp.]|nr:GNAT family N-acetyltransferase [Marinibacterium sp.]